MGFVAKPLGPECLVTQDHFISNRITSFLFYFFSNFWIKVLFINNIQRMHQKRASVFSSVITKFSTPSTILGAKLSQSYLQVPFFLHFATLPISKFVVVGLVRSHPSLIISSIVANLTVVWDSVRTPHISIFTVNLLSTNLTKSTILLSWRFKS